MMIVMREFVSMMIVMREFVYMMIVMRVCRCPSSFWLKTVVGQNIE